MMLAEGLNWEWPQQHRRNVCGREPRLNACVARACLLRRIPHRHA